jgi:hypothetical protein
MKEASQNSATIVLLYLYEVLRVVIKFVDRESRLVVTRRKHNWGIYVY